MTTIDVRPDGVYRADYVPGPPQGCWTALDKEALADDPRRFEIVDGVLYEMSSPSEPHQAAALRFGYHFAGHVEFGGRGRVYPAPFDVELPLTPAVVFQPDLVVVLTHNAGIITGKRIVGAPDIVVEIASLGTSGYDRRVKQDRYARAGVPELWFADPFARAIEVLRLGEKGEYARHCLATDGDPVLSVALPDLALPVSAFFA